MKIAVTADAAGLEAGLDPRFGRCPYFLIVDTDDLSFEAVANPNVSRDSGAGIRAAQLVVEQGARLVLTGNCGPNAHQTLTAAGLGVVVGCSGAVRDVVGNFKVGRYSTTTQPSVPGHSGMTPSADAPDSPSPGLSSPPGSVPGMGRGRGGGLGRGRGGGRGMGRGQAAGRGAALPESTSELECPPARPETTQDLDALRVQSRVIEEQLTALNERIGQVGGAAIAGGLTAIVDADQCIACGLCADVCESGAITIDDVASVDAGKCTACGQCVAQCPVEGITLAKA